MFLHENCRCAPRPQWCIGCIFQVMQRSYGLSSGGRPLAFLVAPWPNISTRHTSQMTCRMHVPSVRKVIWLHDLCVSLVIGPLVQRASPASSKHLPCFFLKVGASLTAIILSKAAAIVIHTNNSYPGHERIWSRFGT